MSFPRSHDADDDDIVSKILTGGDVVTTISTLRITFATSTFTLDSVAVMNNSPNLSTTSAEQSAATALLSEILPFLFSDMGIRTGSQTQSQYYGPYTSSPELPSITASNVLQSSDRIPLTISQIGSSEQSPTAPLVSEGTAASTWSPVSDSSQIASPTTTPINTNAASNHSQSSDQHSQANTQTNILTPILSGVIPFLILCVCLALYFWWRHRKNLRQKEEDDLERTAVWFNGPDKNNRDNGVKPDQETCVTEERDIGTTSINTQDPVLPSRSTGRTDVPNEESQYRSVPISEFANHSQDPFATPTSESGSLVHNYLENSPPRKSQIGLAVTTPSDEEEREISEDSSTQTIIHHTSESDSNPFNDETSENENKDANESYSSIDSDGNTTQGNLKETVVDSTTTNDVNGSSPVSYRAVEILSTILERSEPLEASSKSSSVSSFESFEVEHEPHASDVNKNWPDIEIARQCIWSLKREARNAQIAAAEAERKAAELRSMNNSS